MGIDAIITLLVIFGALLLFATEWLSIDLVGLLIMVSLMLTGVVSPEEGIAGFSNNATITVAFMFVISAALLKTGALQHAAHYISFIFRRNYTLGMLSMMLLIAVISAFINNTPVVAVFIPVVVQISITLKVNPTKMLIPLSFASIMGGVCTLIGTSTNILVSGIAEKEGLPAFDIFLLLPLGSILSVVGIVYMTLVGIRLLPDRERSTDINSRFGLHDYVVEVELLEGGQRIMDWVLVKELDMDIMTVWRSGDLFIMPQGDFRLQAGDRVKVRCDVGKIKSLKERIKVVADTSLTVADSDLTSKSTTLMELVITSDSTFINKNLKELDFRRRFRAIPLAIRHREEVQHDGLYNIPLKAGDLLLIEIKNHYLDALKQLETSPSSPFVLLSEDRLTDFNRPQFAVVLALTFLMILAATTGWVGILNGSMAVVASLVVLRYMSMKEVYQAINWKIIFLLAGSLSLGKAMGNSSLDVLIAEFLVEQLALWGPQLLIGGIYLTTAVLTELMSNNATAALLTPIAIATASHLGLSPTPFLVAVTVAASASFVTPIGYQTNTMIFSAGDYRFRDFSRVGLPLSLLFWLLSTLLIPIFYPFQ